MRFTIRARTLLTRWSARLARPAPDEKIQSYRDIAWENAMEAYNNSPDPPLEVTPYIASRLEAAKHELLLKADRMKRERDVRIRERRRQLVSTATVLSATVALAAGATAVTGTGTGIPAIDSILGVKRSDVARGGDTGQGRGPSLDDFAVAADSEPASVALDLGSAGTVVGSAYLSRTRLLCFVIAQPSAQGLTKPVGGGGCGSSDKIAERLARDTAFIIGTTVDRAVIVVGYAAANVETIDVNGVPGDFIVDLAPEWRTGLTGMPPLRPFLAGVVPNEAHRGIPDVSGLVMDPRNYEIAAHLSDGRTVRLPSAITLTGDDAQN
jgi:hypothetical protein